MDLENYLLEQKMGKTPDLMAFFNSYASQVFAQGFLNKISKAIPNLEIKEVVNGNKNLAAYTNSFETIFVNRPVFYSLSKTEQISILLHEFIHVLQFKKNREIKNLSVQVWDFLNKNKLPDSQVSEIILGRKDIKNKFVNKNEVLPYFMNEKIRWEHMTEGSNKELAELLRRSKIFQVDSKFWQERLK